MPKSVGVVLLLASFVLWFSLVWSPDQGWRFDGIEVATAPKGGEFTLHSQQGPIQLSDLKGKVVLLYFGYTWCPDICPTSLAIISNALNQLSPSEQSKVQPLFISVDPKRDSLERLANYTHYFHPKILGITGTDKEISEVAKQYGAVYRRMDNTTEEGYSVDHTAEINLIDPKGQWVTSIPHETPAKEIEVLVRALIP